MSVTPPAVNDWDVATIAQQAFAVLRLDPAGDPDSDRIETAAAVAVELLDAELDAVDSVNTAAAATLQTAAVQVTVELYRRKDLPFGSGGSFSPSEVPYLIDGDPLAGVRAMTLPWKRRWGIA